MKLYLQILLLFVLVVFTQCQPTQNTNLPQKRIEKYLKAHLVYTKSYQPLSYTSVDTVYNTDTLRSYLDYLKEAVKVKQKLINTLIQKARALENQPLAEKLMLTYLHTSTGINTVMKKQKKRIDSINQVIIEPSSQVVRYEISHIYKCLDTNKKLLTKKVKFPLDTNFHLLENELHQGIDSENAQLTIFVKSASGRYLHAVIDPMLNHQHFATDKRFNTKLKAGKHRLVWKYVHHFSARTFQQMFEMKANEKAFAVILGSKMYKFIDEDSAKKVFKWL